MNVMGPRLFTQKTAVIFSLYVKYPDHLLLSAGTGRLSICDSLAGEDERMKDSYLFLSLQGKSKAHKSLQSGTQNNEDFVLFSSEMYFFFLEDSITS